MHDKATEDFFRRQFEGSGEDTVEPITRRELVVRDSYYTPHPSEFTMGFEYEIQIDPRDGDSWEKIHIQNFMNLKYPTNPKSDGEYRVKYLNQYDIESHGFGDKKVSVDDWYSMDREVIIGNLTYRSFRLIHGHSDNTLRICGFEYAQVSGKGEDLFYGNCKNNSELITILKLIGII